MVRATKEVGFLLLILFIATSVTAQSVIKGTVTSAGTGRPLPAANIYLAHTTVGVAANAAGRYKLKTELTGVYKLVFSFVGYNKKVTEVELTADTTIIVNATLRPRTIQMDKLTVTGSNARRKERLAFFKNEFIGTAGFAEKTKILNSEVLRFKVNTKGQLVAHAVKPLHIINRALGYVIYVELDKFIWNQDGKKGFYRIYPRYKKLTAASEDQFETWHENRQKAYLGSMRHFLKKLYYDNINDGFIVRPGGSLNQLSESETTFKLLGRVPMELANNLKGFKLYNVIVVIYDDTEGAFGYEVDVQKKSAMAATNDNQIFYINKHGLLLDPLSVITGGYWGVQRLANSLPFNYRFKE